MSLLDRATPRQRAMVDTALYLIACTNGIPLPRPRRPIVARTVEEISLVERLVDEIDALESEGLDFGVTL